MLSGQFFRLVAEIDQIPPWTIVLCDVQVELKEPTESFEGGAPAVCGEQCD